jgi:hypothetical protein
MQEEAHVGGREADVRLSHTRRRIPLRPASPVRSERLWPRVADSKDVVVDVPIVEIVPAPDNPRQSLGKLGSVRETTNPV